LLTKQILRVELTFSSYPPASVYPICQTQGCHWSGHSQGKMILQHQGIVGKFYFESGKISNFAEKWENVKNFLHGVLAG